MEKARGILDIYRDIYKVLMPVRFWKILKPVRPEMYWKRIKTKQVEGSYFILILN